jgi:hypothetical protein
MPESLLGVERIVFVFDAEHSAIANLAQMANVLAPADFAITGNRVTPPAVSKDANILSPLRINQAILGVGMENPLTVSLDWYDNVQVLVDQVGGIVVQPEMRVGKGLQQAIEGIDSCLLAHAQAK